MCRPCLTRETREVNKVGPGPEELCKIFEKMMRALNPTSGPTTLSPICQAQIPRTNHVKLKAKSISYEARSTLKSPTPKGAARYSYCPRFLPVRGTTVVVTKPRGKTLVQNPYNQPFRPQLKGVLCSFTIILLSLTTSLPQATNSFRLGPSPSLPNVILCACRYRSTVIPSIQYINNLKIFA